MSFNDDDFSQRDLELMILEDMEEWVSIKLLKGEDMYDYLERVEEQSGTDARKQALETLTSKYWQNHILPL